MINGNRAGKGHYKGFIPGIAFPYDDVVIRIQRSEVFIVSIPYEAKNFIVVAEFFDFRCILR